MKKENLNKFLIIISVFLLLLIAFCSFILSHSIKSLVDVNNELSDRCVTFCELNNQGSNVLNQCLDGLNYLSNTSINKISSDEFDCYNLCGW